MGEGVRVTTGELGRRAHAGGTGRCPIRSGSRRMWPAISPMGAGTDRERAFAYAGHVPDIGAPEDGPFRAPLPRLTDWRLRAPRCAHGLEGSELIAELVAHVIDFVGAEPQLLADLVELGALGRGDAVIRRTHCEGCPEQVFPLFAGGIVRKLARDHEILGRAVQLGHVARHLHDEHRLCLAEMPDLDDRSLHELHFGRAELKVSMGGAREDIGEAGDEAPLLDGQRLDLAGDTADRFRLGVGGRARCRLGLLRLIVAAEEASKDHGGYLGYKQGWFLRTHDASTSRHGAGWAARPASMLPRLRDVSFSTPYKEGPSRPAATAAPVRIRITRWHARVWLIAVVAAVITFTILFEAIEGWSFSDALYMTVITLTTVGYGEVRTLDESGRVVAMAAAVVGTALLFGGVGIMAEVVLAEIGSGRRERRKMQERITGMSDHYIVCGFGRVGSTVAAELRGSGRSVVVVDVLADSVERAKEDGYLVVEGDATDEPTLLAAGIERATGLVATIDEDAYNVYVVLSARTLNRQLFIVGRANAPIAEARLKRAGANRIVSPYTMAGHRIAELAVRPAVSDYIDAALSRAHLSFSIEEYRVAKGGPLDGTSVGDLLARGIFTLAIVRGPGAYDANPPPERTLQAGEELILSASRDTLLTLLGGVGAGRAPDRTAGAPSDS